MWLASQVVAVVPALDEAPRIAGVLRGMPAWVDDIVVVDDASVDGTTDVARAHADRRVHVLRHAANRGVGAAIASGYRHALTMPGGPRDVFVVMAGDGQMDPNDLPALVGPIVRGQADYAKGTRFRSVQTLKVMPLARLVGGLAFSWATACAIGVDISDSQCGYTAIAREACSRLDLDGLWPGYGYPNDLLSQVALRRLRIAQVAVRAVYADEVSRLRLRHIPGVARIVARAWLRRMLHAS